MGMSHDGWLDRCEYLTHRASAACHFDYVLQWTILGNYSQQLVRLVQLTQNVQSPLAIETHFFNQNIRIFILKNLHMNVLSAEYFPMTFFFFT